MRERGLANLRAAKTLFEDAIQRDPRYASAYSGLADAYYLLMTNHAQELQQGDQLGERAADRALELDPASSEAHASRANFALRRHQQHGDVQGLERASADYQRAIELDPSNAQAHHWYGDAVRERDPDRALRLFERAVELDPLMREAQLAAADVFRYQGEFDRARGHVNHVINRYPDFADAYIAGGAVEWNSGHLVDARSWFRKAYELAADPLAAAYVYYVSLQLGDRATAAEWLPRNADDDLYWGESSRLTAEGEYSRALEASTRVLERIDEGWFAVQAAHLALIVGQPERASAILLKRYPELANDESPIDRWKCDAAIALAANWQRTNQRPEADRLLRRTAVWLDSAQAPRRPARHFVRAQVHALLGQRDQAFDALDRAFEEGHPGALALSLAGAYFYRGEPLFDSIRSDPRFTALFARIHADNARQLAKMKAQHAPSP